jgi:hypothetical protein
VRFGSSDRASTNIAPEFSLCVVRLVKAAAAHPRAQDDEQRSRA